nr:sugar phosphate nucleotidyltransferase [Wolbachia endosymbiont of Mansonella perstans]
MNNDYYWNSGIFVFKAKHYVNEMKRSAPNLYNLCCASFQHSTTRKISVFKTAGFYGN